MMRRLFRFLTLVTALGLLAVVRPGTGQGPAPKTARPQFKIAPTADIEKARRGPSYPTAGPEVYFAEIVEDNLNALGGEGWEVQAANRHGWVFQRVEGGPKWEYRVLPSRPDSLLSGQKGGADKIVQGLEAMAAEGWEICAASSPEPAAVAKSAAQGPAKAPPDPAVVAGNVHIYKRPKKAGK